MPGKFNAPPPPPPPEKKKGPVSKLETPEPIVPPSEQLTTSTLYLTNIARLLLPNHLSESPTVSVLKDEKEIDTEVIKLQEELEGIGLSSFMDIDRENDLKNYSKNEGGDTQFTAPITPWKVDIVSGHHAIEVLFSEETLRDAISEVSDPNIQKECTEYLEKIHTLLEEEKKNYQEADNARLLDAEPGIKEAEEAFNAFEAKHNVEALSTITSAQEALASTERTAAKNDLLKIWAQLNTLRETTKVTTERHTELYGRYQRLFSRAVGAMRGGVVDHTRS